MSQLTSYFPLIVFVSFWIFEDKYGNINPVINSQTSYYSINIFKKNGI